MGITLDHRPLAQQYKAPLSLRMFGHFRTNTVLGGTGRGYMRSNEAPPSVGNTTRVTLSDLHIPYYRSQDRVHNIL